jgi:hypothetical protein
MAVGVRLEAARREMIGEAILLVTRERGNQPVRSGELFRNIGLAYNLEASHGVWIGPLQGAHGDGSGQCAL